MACNSPMEAYRFKGDIVFNRPYVGAAPIYLPCGGCKACRITYKNTWAIRCIKELLYHDTSMFITLTYNNDNLPLHGSLRPDDVTNFIKRYRAMLEREDQNNGLSKENYRKFSYFYCGEYGDNLGRPHYHIIIFGHRFDDAKKLRKSQKGGQLFDSVKLSRLWKFGWSNFGDVTFESCAYVAGYVSKKINGSAKWDHYDTGLVHDFTGEIIIKQPEFARMSKGSRNADGEKVSYAIGERFYLDHCHSLFEQGYVTRQGKKTKYQIPRYYKKRYKEEFPLQYANYEKLLKERLKAGFFKRSEEDMERNEKFLIAQEKNFINSRNLAV